jgi:hypothetical protein
MPLDELSRALGSDDPQVQDDAVRRLEALGGSQAISLLAACLDQGAWRQAKGFDPDWRGPAGERLQGRIIYEPLSYLAVRALVGLVPDPPAPPLSDPLTDEDVRRWKAWWERNRERYTSGDAGGAPGA